MNPLAASWAFMRAFVADEGWQRCWRAWPCKIAAARSVPAGDWRSTPGPTQARPLSIVVLACTGEERHNALASQAAQDPRNQVVVIDLSDHAEHATRSAAINVGLRAAVHETVVVAHEDVYLPDGWHACLHDRIARLERQDADWAVMGVAGWDAAGKAVGHVRHVHRALDTFRDDATWTEAVGIDDMLIVLRRRDGLRMDESCPGLRGQATDLVQRALSQGRRSYVVDVPTIHRWRDARGRPIRRGLDAAKVRDRVCSAHRAERDVGLEYVARKWPRAAGYPWDPEAGLSPAPARTRRPALAVDAAAVDAPVILVCRGGSGSRLLATAVDDCGVFLGRERNASDDTMEFAVPVYKALFRKYREGGSAAAAATVAELRATAVDMLAASGRRRGGPWGFKIPESILLLPELHGAFPEARYVFLVRDPVASCLGRPHHSAMLESPLGRLLLPPSYDHVGRERLRMRTDSPAERMAVATVFQLQTAFSWRSSHMPRADCLDIRFERLVAAPRGELARLAEFLDRRVVSRRLERRVDTGRGRRRGVVLPGGVVESVREILRPLERFLP